MIKGILFDKDGTLIEFENMWHQIMTLVFQQLELKGISHKLIQLYKEHAGYLEDGFEKESAIQYKSTRTIIQEWLAFENHENKEDQQRGISYETIMMAFETAAIDLRVNTQLLEGVQPALDYLVQRGYTLGIATADTYTSTLHSLKNTGILEHFSFIGSDDGIMRPKPDTDMAQRFCQNAKITYDELLIIGDSINDFRFAQNAGAAFAGISSPHSKLNSLQKEENLLIMGTSLQTIIREMSL